MSYCEVTNRGPASVTHKLRYAHSISLADSYGHGHLAVTKHLRETREERVISSSRLQNSSLRHRVIMAAGTDASVFKQKKCVSGNSRLLAVPKEECTDQR